MSHTVLIVDDSVTAYQQLKDILESSGEFEVLGHAQSGDEALQLYQEKKPDLVTMDMVMPGISGAEAIRLLLAADPGARVVLASSMSGVKSQVVAALSAGAKNIIPKPFDKARTLATLRQVMATK